MSSVLHSAPSRPLAPVPVHGLMDLQMSPAEAAREGLCPSQDSQQAAVAESPAVIESPVVQQALIPFSLPKDGRSIRTLPNGVNCTAEKRIIAAHYAFHGQTKRPLGEALTALGVGRTALYRWRAEYEELVKPSNSPSAPLKLHLEALSLRTDAQNLARFLDLSPAVNSPNASGTGPLVRADGLGPQAEVAGEEAGPLQPAQLPIEQLNDICRVGGAELPTEEEAKKVGFEVDEDLNEEGSALVEESLNNAVILHKSSQRDSTQGIWKGPQQKFLAFFRGLARLRAGEGQPVNKDVMVTEQKLVTFLNCFVLRKKPWLAVETIDSHIKAITDLWKQQQLEGKNHHPSPREGGLVKAYRQAIIKSKARQSASSYEDKAKHSLADGYDEREHERISQWYLKRASQSDKPHSSLRARLDFLLSHAIMGRSEDLRDAKLSDLYSYTLPYSSPHPCQALVITFLESKANTGGRKERGVAIRHRNVEVCPLGALAQYLFYRFNVCGEAPPDFTTRRDWYDRLLLVSSSDPTRGITWDTQADLLRKCFEELDITSSKLTHAMRGGGARFASAAGCSEDSIRKHGRWCGDRLMERYLTSVSISPVRALAGFSIQGGDHWLPRSIQDASDELCSMVFPWVEAAEAELDKKAGSDRDEAGVEFLKLLKFLRQVLLQDSVFLKSAYPHLPLWSHSPFNTSLFSSFSAQLLQRIKDTPCPLDAHLTTIVPTIGHALADVRAQIASLRASFGDVKVTMSGVSEQLGQLHSSLTQNPHDDGHQQHALLGAHAALMRGIQAMSDASQQISTSLSNAAGRAPAPTSAQGAPLALPRLALAPLQPPSPAAPAHDAPKSWAAADLPAIDTLQSLISVWTTSANGRTPLSSFSTAGQSGAVQQKMSRWRRLANEVDRLALAETGTGVARKRRSADEVAQALDRTMKRRKVGLRKLVDVFAKADEKEEFLQDVEWI